MDGREHVDLAMRLSPLDPLYYAMLAARGLTHVAVGEDREAAQWLERAARSPGAHALIAMIAAATEKLAGNDVLATAWAEDVRKRSPLLNRTDFFRDVWVLQGHDVSTNPSAAHCETLGEQIVILCL